MAKGKPRQVEEVSKGGRGKVNEVKAAAVATAKEHGISKSTVERSFAKAEGRKPEPKIAGPKQDKAELGNPCRHRRSPPILRSSVHQA